MCLIKSIIFYRKFSCTPSFRKRNKIIKKNKYFEQSIFLPYLSEDAKKKNERNYNDHLYGSHIDCDNILLS